MSQLALPNDLRPSGYAAQRRRPPGALAAAIALNGGAFALILLAPATQFVTQFEPGLRTHNIPLDPDPPTSKTDPVKPHDPVPTQKTINHPIDEAQTFVLKPVVPTGGGLVLDGDGLTKLGPLGGAEEVKQVDPPHVPVFVKASQDPRFAKAFHPDYPPALRREGLEGSVTVRISIDASGRVIACDLVKATNAAFFEETKEQALRYWRFKPATSDGMPVPSEQVLTVQFHLEEG